LRSNNELFARTRVRAHTHKFKLELDTHFYKDIL